MTALTRTEYLAHITGVTPYGGREVEMPGGPLLDHTDEWSRTTARRCAVRGIALHWTLADECRRTRLSASELLHVAGVLHELIGDAIHDGCARNVWVSFGRAWNGLTLVIEDDGGDPNGLFRPGSQSQVCNVEYRAAQAAGAIRRRSRGWCRAAVFCLLATASARQGTLLSTAERSLHPIRHSPERP